MLKDRDGRTPEPKSVGLCTLGTRMIAIFPTHGTPHWRHYQECACPDYDPGEWGSAEVNALLVLGAGPFSSPEAAEEFRTAALELLVGIGSAPQAVKMILQAARDEADKILRPARDEVAQARRERDKAALHYYVTAEGDVIMARRERDAILNRARSEAEIVAKNTIADLLEKAQWDARKIHDDAQIEAGRLRLDARMFAQEDAEAATAEAAKKILDDAHEEAKRVRFLAYEEAKRMKQKASA